MNDKKWICDICEKQFSSYKTHWTHVNNKKTTCMSKKQCNEIQQENEKNIKKLRCFEIKIQEQETEIQNLKYMVSKLLHIDDIQSRVASNLNSVDANSTRGRVVDKDIKHII